MPNNDLRERMEALKQELDNIYMSPGIESEVNTLITAMEKVAKILDRLVRIEEIRSKREQPTNQQ